VLCPDTPYKEQYLLILNIGELEIGCITLALNISRSAYWGTPVACSVDIPGTDMKALKQYVRLQLKLDISEAVIKSRILG